MNKLPKGRWRKTIYAKNPILFFMSFETDQRKRPEYVDNLTKIVVLIHRFLADFVNYAHVSFITPKSNIPLKIAGEHWDIAYLDKNRNLVLIKLKVIPKEHLPKIIEG